ncbi:MULTISPECIES: mycothiol conjugate amidase Mca [Arthrobacter]|uniref:Mycothiol S-conjugate amidase n=2 Tax=Arthrobacter TaxID=1663 RepID=A0ABU9KKG8_9MICC|nr:mycothiol conjugate amidase Mca [Arthrobacter sp. YJM1]MDP5227393.1 mycothiol conjugate amidase Mca [Arthrobacter sp. YJM1]
MSVVDAIVPDASTQETLRVMFVHAHPDDESSKGAATMARYVDQGAEVLVATCTDGSRGDIQNPGMETAPHPKRDMAGARRQEMDRAAEVLGVQQQWLGFIDSGLPEGDPLPPLPAGSFAVQPLEIAAAPLVRLVRAFRPHVVVAYDENGGYPHPDHIMAHRVAVEAYHAAGDPDRYPGTGAAWEPSKLYYDCGMSLPRMRALRDAAREEGLQIPNLGWIDAWLDSKAEPLHIPTTRIDCGEWFPRRDDALRAHRTQIDPDGFFFAFPAELQRRIWPYEEFVLIHSRLGETVPETDLFAGLR